MFSHARMRKTVVTMCSVRSDHATCSAVALLAALAVPGSAAADTYCSPTLEVELLEVSPGRTDEGACCDADTVACTVEAEWICKEQGNVFLGPGTSCNICGSNPFVTCNVPPDCVACDNGDRIDEKCGDVACPDGTCTTGFCLGGFNDGNACTENVDCEDGEDDGVCVLDEDRCNGGTKHGERCDCPGGTCVDYTAGGCQVPLACTLHACCETATGECAIGFCDGDSSKPCNDHQDSSDCGVCVGGTNDGGFCNNIHHCPGGISCDPSGETCVQVDPVGGNDCPLGWTPLGGYGYACVNTGAGNDQNCCEQPEDKWRDPVEEGPWSGGDNCEDAFIHLINVPWHEDSPITITITGDNTLAAGPDSCASLESDPGWWEGFEIDACANVRIDLGCTDPLHIPVYAHLYRGCPCEERIKSTPIIPPIGEGFGASLGFGDYFTDGNLWATFGPLPPGVYYYPVFSETDLTRHQYQVHITVVGCPQAACCTGDTCQLVNELDCQELGGYWLAGWNIPDDMFPVVTCDPNPCHIGACCLGLAGCEDRVSEHIECDPEQPETCMNRSICEAMQGDYVGGPRCDWPADPCQPCDDRNHCTDDFVDQSGCLNVPNYNVITECCDPFTGDTEKLVDEGNPCTFDLCDPAIGQVWHVPLWCVDDADCFPGICEYGSCSCSACDPSSSPPQPERLDLPGWMPEPYPISQKVRYISFEAADSDRLQAIRLTLFDLPAPYNPWNGSQLWVQEPQMYCENGGAVQCVGMPDCCPDSVGSLPQKWFWGATLGCNPYWTDWGEYGLVHVFHEGIIPSKCRISTCGPSDVSPGVCATYLVEVIGISCRLDDPENYSQPLIATMSSWADVVKDCSTTPCGPPDGTTGIVDVTAVLDKYKNLTGNVMKARADLEGSPAGNPPLPDQSINITDVTFCLGAFLGDCYPPPGFPPPSPPPFSPGGECFEGARPGE